MAGQLANSVRITDGQLDWSAGVDSSRVPTMQSTAAPNGLKRNQLAWLQNATVRGGGILQRTGWRKVELQFGAVPKWSGLFQGGFMYEPLTENPKLVFSIGGRIYDIRVDTDNQVRDLSTLSGLVNPPNIGQAYFCQGEQFLVIQAGDFTTLPLFWDGTNMTRSLGIVGAGDPTNQLPAAGPMDYFMGRLWYAVGRTYAAGDIVRNLTSGTAPFNYTDSILHVTENPLAAGGDGFIVPSNAGNIRALKHSANLDTALGQGQLFVFTRKSIYSLNVPVTRTDWVAAGNNNQPLQRVMQIGFGTTSDRSVVPVNGDLFYQSPEPSIRSLQLSIRYFSSWANTPISNNEQRVLQFNDRSLLHAASGILFDNRLWQTALPVLTPVGVAHQAVIPLDYDLISSLGEKLPPAWEGVYDGLDILQLFVGDFGGRERAFAAVLSRMTGEIELWELTLDQKFENGDNRVEWGFETPAFTFGNPYALNDLDGMELWIDKLFGTTVFTAYYKNDQNPCWTLWHSWKECVARDCREDSDFPPCPPYPVIPYCEGYKSMMALPKPPAACDTSNGRPTTRGFQFQVKLVIKGWCRIRGLMLYGIPVDRQRFENLVC